MSSVSYHLVVQRALAAVTSTRRRMRITDLSSMAGVSERTLRNAFHDVCGISPTQYFRRHRLEAARRGLTQARGTRGAVTTVATECGFFELGRFSVAYRQMFGERPSDTARRGDGR
jgi:transcriptional regulator GlxA family with amidase domain